MILVADSSSLIVLERIGQLNLLGKLADSTHIPEAVYQEVAGHGARRPETAALLSAANIVRAQVRDRARVERLRNYLGWGESEAIVLAGEIDSDFLLLDDARARRIAESEGCRVVGLLGLLIRAKELAIVDYVKPVLDEMVGAGFFIHDDLYRLVLRRAGELL